MAKPIRKILFTSDLTKASVQMFEQTVVLASQLGASISILHVIEDGSTGSQNRMVHLVDRDVYERIRNENRENVKQALIGKEKSVPVIENALRALCNDVPDKNDIPHVKIDSIEVHYGDPTEHITAFSRSADLVVMGYYRKGSLLRALMGSAGRNVIKKSQIPIFLIPIG